MAPCDTQTPCVSNQQCIAGGCCRTPTACPDGRQPTGTCQSPTNSCPNSADYCVNGVSCCPKARCADNSLATQPCTPSGTCPTGMTCVLGGCCQTAASAQCPDNSPFSRTCTTPDQCPITEYCFSGRGCCKIPICSNGRPAVTPCTGTGQSTCPNGLVN